ncbi:MAG: phosphatidylserine/phosphatidylglycerophosphate/cardiolipin synthase family protein [Gammaproteobacteria bacterium]|nr:phosphatidylserine/phosphatidylglycerophosphate/cardiolipin synthase family protein [Gammaproteobacteria bacterium]
MTQGKHPPQLNPWRLGNAFRLMRDAERFYPAMLEAINNARHSILLEMYLVESGREADRFIDALLGAAERGVQVFIIIDDLGSGLLSERDRRRLNRPGVQTLIYNPLRLSRMFANVYRDHRKQLTVDGELSFTGGMGISDVFSAEVRGKLAWRETVIEIRGPVVADWHRVFADNWNYWSDTPLPLPEPSPASQEADQPGRVVATRGGERLEIKRSLIRAVRSANERIWISTAYFMPSRKLRRELRQADQRGVDVRLLLPGQKTDHPSVRYAGRRYFRRLLRAGVRIYEYRPRFIHAKQVICDDWVSIGSANYDRWSFRWTLEANQEVDSPLIAHQARELFLKDLEEAHEITYEAWQSRPRIERLRESFWGWVDRLLEAFHHRHRLWRLNPFRHKRRR